MQFKDIIGQEAIKAHLRSGVRQGRISHAQLFAGGEGVGALPLAIAYAQYINCPNRTEDDSCGVCPSCHQIGELAHPDLHFVFPVNNPKGKSTSEKPISSRFMAEWRDLVRRTKGYFNEAIWYRAIDIDNKQGNISTFEADEIIRNLSFKSFESEYKIVLIWLPERMNVQAANKLLKILEEPWEKTLFLMISEAPEKLLATIISRTQSVHIPAISPEDLTAYLTVSANIPPEEARKMTHLSRGNLLEAERILESMRSGEDNQSFELFVQLMRLSYENRHLELLDWADTVAGLGREEQKRVLAYAVNLLRNSFMLTAGLPDIAYLFGKEYEFCKRFAPYVSTHNIESLLAEFELTIRQIVQNGNPRIILPHFALSVSKMINKV